MQQIYNDFPEFFSQENKNDLGYTIYKAEIFIVSREEAHLLNVIKQRRR